jgi:hypothetical protein
MSRPTPPASRSSVRVSNRWTWSFWHYEGELLALAETLLDRELGEYRDDLDARVDLALALLT